MNAAFWGILNGIAKDAKNGTYNGGAPDTNVMSWCEKVAQQAEYNLGSNYDASTSYTTTYYITGLGTTASTGPEYPAGNVSPSWDALTQVGTGLTFKQQGA